MFCTVHQHAYVTVCSECQVAEQSKRPLVVYDAVSSGPVSSMPGSVHSAPTDAACVDHEDRPAIHRVQGETDSFGCEYHDLCQECYDAHKAARAAQLAEHAVGTCDWCSNHVTDLRDARDYDEGMAGPLYRVCGACIKRRNDEAHAELEAAGYFDQQDDDSEYDSDPTDYLVEEQFHEESEAEMEEPNYLQDTHRTMSSFLGNDDRPYGQPKAWVDGKYIW